MYAEDAHNYLLCEIHHVIVMIPLILLKLLNVTLVHLILWFHWNKEHLNREIHTHIYKYIYFIYVNAFHVYWKQKYLQYLSNYFTLNNPLNGCLKKKPR